MLQETEPDTPEKQYSERLSCSKTTKKLILNDCIKEYLVYHPELKGLRITQSFILSKIARHYVGLK